MAEKTQQRKRIIGRNNNQEKKVIDCLQSASKPLNLADLSEQLGQEPVSLNYAAGDGGKVR